MLLNDFIDLFEREENPTNFLQTFVEVLGPTSSESSQKLQLFLVDERLRNLRGPARKKVADFLHQVHKLFQPSPTTANQPTFS